MTNTGLAAVQVKAGEDQKSNNLPSLVFFKVLEFLGQKKGNGSNSEIAETIEMVANETRITSAIVHTNHSKLLIFS
ncbi:hypothetical protein QLQ09_08935 [Brucella sp. NM4]|uniref:hypothetical protein n=1 Tax=Brucella sp. NM4 TaxID=3045175 RepID=UPI0024BCC033|nr:hypothetical protein [Brucella sp. NM4]WHS32077.1 hypothetical protein QLQ09_08935 [Brucella sp. NM4]